MAKRDNGEGTIFKRGDGRWCAKINVTLPNGEIKRVSVVKKDRTIVKAQLDEWKERNKKHLPHSEEDWTVEAYITHWLNDIMPHKIRLGTLLRYRGIIDRYIIPSIGKIPLKELSVHHLQNAVDDLTRRGASSNLVLKFRRILSSCLMHAMRQELIFRNVASLITLPKYSPKKITPWTAEQAKRFLRETKDHKLHIAYAIMLTYGLRKGEMLGLRWSDISFSNDIIFVRQQICWLDGKFHASAVKTDAGRRTLPLIPEIKRELLSYAAQKGIEIPPYETADTFSMENLLLTTSNNTPISPNNFKRSFLKHIEKAGLPRITVHTLRHTAATLLKNIGIPVKDAQLILGHSDISTTLKIYQHGDVETQKTALRAIGAALHR